MALSYTQYTEINSPAHTYAITFKFLDTSHVKLSVTSAGSMVDHTNFTISSDGATMTVGGAYEVPIKIYRQTPGTTVATKDDKVVDFNDGSVITENDLDRSTLQALYASQESKDYVDDSIDASTGTGELPTTANANYILSSNTGSPAAPAWISTTDLKSILPAAVANTASTIPIRSADPTPTVTTSIVGDVTGNVTGNVTGSAGTLSPGKTISISGDVTYESPVYTGAANITSTATVGRIQNQIVSSATPAAGEVLRYRGDTWTPEPGNLKWVMFVQQVSGTTDGFDLTDAQKRWPIPITSTASNPTLTSVTLDDSTYVMTVPEGNYMVRWTQAFYKCHTGFVDLMQSNVSTTGTEDGVGGMLDSSANRGRSTTTYTTDQNNVQICQGSARVVVSGTKYWQLQAYAELGGSLGNSNASSGQFYYTTIEIVKEH